jgi:two-component system, sensor histidine kinase ChiS
MLIVKTTATSVFWKLKVFLPLLLLTACTGTPRDNGTSLPPPLYLQPQAIAANPEGGYAVNPLTGDSIQSLVNSLGDTLVTGVPIPIMPKFIHPDSVDSPEVVNAPSIESLKKHKAHLNRYKIPENIPTISVDIGQLKTIPVKLAEKQPGGLLDAAHYLVNSTGDTIPTGVPIPVKGKLVKARQPKPTKALPPAIKDAAIVNLQYLNVDQGMNASYVYSILEDKSGNLWFGTNGGGVSKYDGESFSHFTENEGLSNNSVWAILEDKSGNLWFGTLGGGVSKYDGENFSHFTENEGLSNNRVLAILEDKSGNLWFGTEGGGVSKYDGESFLHFTENEGLSNNSVFSILEDKSGNLWFGTNGGGVSKYDPAISGTSSGSFTYFTEKEGLSNNNVWSIFEDKSGNLWFGTWDGGVSKYNPAESGTSSGIFTHFTENEGLSSNRVLSIVEDKSGNLWFGTFGGGVSKYDPAKSGTSSGGFTHFTEKEGLSNNIVFSILEDNSGNLWFGTIGGGVSRYNRESFSHFTENEGLGSTNVLSMFEDKNGNLWFGTLDGGVSKYDGESFTHFTEKEGLSDNSVRSILEDKSGNLWFGTFGGGVSKYEPAESGTSSGSFTHFTEKEGLSNNTVLSIIEDKSGNLWFGTNGGGVSKYDGKSFSHFTANEGLSNNTVWSILEDKSGNLWFGTWGGGVSKYEPAESGTSSGSLTHFTEKEGLSNNHVRSILEDENGNLWFGTLGGGVSKYEPAESGTSSGSFIHFTEKEGLSNNRVLSILESKSNNIWLGTERGLIHIKALPEPVKGSKDGISVSPVQKATPTVQVFGKQDGLKGLHFFANSVFLDSKNRAWWGNVNGLSILDLNTFQLSQDPPVIYLKQLDVNEEFIDYRNISESLGKNIQFSGVEPFTNYPLNLELPYHKNHLTFYFAAIDWSAPHKIHYSYRMLGLNNNWSTPSQEAKADYRNLSYGHYTFQIRAIGESGEWSEPLEYTFTIRPPLWYSWWAIFFYVSLFILGLYGLRRYDMNRIQFRNQLKLEKLTTDSLRNLDHLKTQFFTNISHEFRTPLTLILGPIEKMREEARDSKTQKTLSMVYHNAEKLLALINQLLELSKLESGNYQLKAAKGDFIPLMESLVMSFASRAEQKNIKLEFNFDPQLSRPEFTDHFYFDHDIIEKIVNNLLSNAFKFTPENGHVKVEACLNRLKDKGQVVEVIFRDSGIGIPAEKLPFIFDRFYQVDASTKRDYDGSGIGLALVKDLVDQHKGSIIVKSRTGKGTTFSLRLPFGKEHYSSDQIASKPPVEVKKENGNGIAKALQDKELDWQLSPANETNGPLVLVVEDHAEVRRFIAENLEEHFRVQEAENALEGQRLAIDMIPDLIISDVMMPGMDGFEFCEKLKTDERTSHIPVILLTARAEDPDRMRGLETGADDYLTKPFNPRELLIRATNLMENRRLMREKFSTNTIIKPGEISVTSRDRAFMEKLMGIMEKNMDNEKFSVEDLASEAGMSQSQLHRKLKALINQTANHFIRSVRMHRAMELLEKDAGNIAEIAYMVGYDDPGYFTKSFKAFFGILPSEIRKT